MTVIVNSEEWERLSSEEKNCTIASQRYAISLQYLFF